MKNVKKIVVTILCLICSVVGYGASYDFMIGGIAYKIIKNGEEVQVTSKGGSYAGKVIIPSEVKYLSKSYVVTEISAAAFGSSKELTEVVIPSSVTSIGQRAFSGCSGLTEVVIPSSVTSIGQCAFWGCSGLTEVVIPSSVTSIGNEAFKNCSGLTKVVIPSSVVSIGKDVFQGCVFLKEHFENNSMCQDSSAFLCDELVDGGFALSQGKLVRYFGKSDSVTIPDRITCIGDYAFSGCSGLTEVVIPGSVTSIGDYAFSGCSGLTEVVIPGSVTSIGDYAFSGCSGLTEVVIPGSVKSIGTNAFYGCGVLGKVMIPSSVTNIGTNAFKGCITTKDNYVNNSSCLIEDIDFVNQAEKTKEGLVVVNGELQRYTGNSENVNIPSSVMSISEYAFSDCSGLTQVIIPNSVTSIGIGAFYGCSGLTQVIIPNSVTSIGGEAFSGCSGLTHVVIPASVTSIRSRTFYKCSGLTEVVIPDSVTSIEYYAFYGCKGLTEVVIPSSVTSIGESAFQNCGALDKVVIPSSVTSVMGIGSYVFTGCYVERDKFVNNSEFQNLGITIVDYITENGFVVVDGKLVKYSGDFQSVEIPSSVTSIGAQAFQGCLGLTEITIPSSVTSIGAQAFQGCLGLTEITIPSSVTSIGDQAFQGCTDLRQVLVPNSLTYFGKQVFDGCSSLTSVMLEEGLSYISEKAFSGCTSLVNLKIPSTVTSIGIDAFNGCTHLESLEIPSSVTSIGKNAFAECLCLKSVKVNWDRPVACEFFGPDFMTYGVLYVPVGTSSMYKSAPNWLDIVNIQEYDDGEEIHYIDIRQGNGGFVRQIVDLGKTYQYYIIPENGWKVNSVSFNGTDVTDFVYNNQYSTPLITRNSELFVVFEQELGNAINAPLRQSNVKVLACVDGIVVSGASEIDDVYVYSLDGVLESMSKGNGFVTLRNGVYVVKIGNSTFKVAL